MSRFSGKCDMYDWFFNSDKPRNYDKIKIYTRNMYVPLAVKSDKEMALLFPFIPAVISSSSGITSVILGENHIDAEERDMLSLYLNYILKYYRKCKRNKKEFIKDECIKSCSFLCNLDAIKELVDRVGRLGENADINGIYLPSADYYRSEWHRALLEYGYTENLANTYVYGVGRNIDNNGGEFVIEINDGEE